MTSLVVYRLVHAPVIIDSLLYVRRAKAGFDSQPGRHGFQPTKQIEASPERPWLMSYIQREQQVPFRRCPRPTYPYQHKIPPPKDDTNPFSQTLIFDTNLPSHVIVILQSLGTVLPAVKRGASYTDSKALANVYGERVYRGKRMKNEQAFFFFGCLPFCLHCNPSSTHLHRHTLTFTTTPFLYPTRHLRPPPPFRQRTPELPPKATSPSSLFFFFFASAFCGGENASSPRFIIGLKGVVKNVLLRLRVLLLEEAYIADRNKDLFIAQRSRFVRAGIPTLVNVSGSGGNYLNPPNPLCLIVVVLSDRSKRIAMELYHLYYQKRSFAPAYYFLGFSRKKQYHHVDSLQKGPAEATRSTEITICPCFLRTTFRSNDPLSPHMPTPTNLDSPFTLLALERSLLHFPTLVRVVPSSPQPDDDVISNAMEIVERMTPPSNRTEHFQKSCPYNGPD
ncbi:hypothetical protein WG66_009683 [Moniliophthora roreri]|nr:hypothetical protein WG66_009683 [Moniliophthora roreri]